jgi:Tol biopolymer transport system component
MIQTKATLALLAGVLLAAGAAGRPDPNQKKELRSAGEIHFGPLRQLTFDGDNAEAYWSPDGTELIYQSSRAPFSCDQIYRLHLTDEKPEPILVSTGKGRTTCSYFLADGKRIFYASTHRQSEACPPPPDRSHGYTWALYPYDIFTARPDGTDLKPLTESPGYDAEGTVCSRDGSIIFTSTRDGDLDLYRMDADGSHIRRITDEPGYDGGAFFSPDCSKIVWRASRPSPGKELDDYRRLLAQGLVRPTQLEIWVANADGTDARQITYLRAASFAPSFYPSGKRIIFSSNTGDPKGREFDLWAINTDGTELERVTDTPGFDGFPMFSPDGRFLAFASNRANLRPGETDIFVAPWIDAPARVVPTAADRTMADIQWLADDAREGRGMGTAGLTASAAWIEARFRQLGLTPAGDHGTYRQRFDVPVSIRVASETALWLDGKPVSREQFEPAGFSTSGAAEGDVVFAGWGITAPEVDFDDYRGISVKNKIVLVRRFAPEEGPFQDEKLQRRTSDLRSKAWNAREHGAAALIVADLPPPVSGKPAPAEPPLPLPSVETGTDAGIPVILLKRADAERLLSESHRARLRVSVAVEIEPAFNIIGKIPAEAPDRVRGTVLVGAHYDHLGMGGRGSMAPDVRDIHHGADDNASGTAALFAIARALRPQAARLRRDITLVAFSGEEEGVLGSTAFTRHPPGGLDLSDIVAMLNMDMIGRLRHNKLTVIGGQSAAEWPQIVSQACERARIECSIGGDAYGPSDQSPFYAAGVSALHFFTGVHDDYHKPTDTADKINAAGEVQIADLVADLAEAVSNRPTALTYHASPAPAPMGDIRSYGASLGTIPDYAGPPRGRSGVLLAGVRPGSPAEAAGMKRGDILVRLGSHEIRNVEDFEFALRSSKPGEKAIAVVERDGHRLELAVTFGARRR